MITEKWKNNIKYYRVELDPRDGSKDYWLSAVRVKDLYARGLLNYNETNHQYCTPNVNIKVE